MRELNLLDQLVRKKIWGSDIGDEIREIFQEFYDFIYEGFTEVRFSPTV